MGKRNYLVYMPVGRSSWYLLVTVPANVLETTTRSFRNFMIAALLVTVVLLLCFCTIYFMGRQHIIDKKNREILVKEQISKKQLADALEEARQANRAKSIFLSNMSHDIRTPMNAIIGMTGIALSHIDRKEKVKDCLNKISTASAHLLSLINDVLDMSRIESGKLTLNSENFNLRDLFHTLEGIIQPQIISGHFDFTVDMEELEHEDLIGDPLRFKQLFLNIVGNS
ncbi:response regulator, partial [Blautia pseudococcoides]|nr:response regulator [Blautia pseudococcoides]